MKYLILISAFFLNLGCLLAQYQNSPPIHLIDSTDNSYMLWQAQFCPVAATSLSNGEYRLIGGHLTSLPILSSFMTNGDSFRIQAVRVLDTLNNGDSLQNTIFPVAVFHVSDDANFRYKYSDGAFNFGKVDIDSTASKKIIIKNAGNSKLIIPKGLLYNRVSKLLTSTDTISSIHILRNDPIWMNEIKWQIRQKQEAPLKGNPLNNAESKYDILESSLIPGETDSFYIDVRPSVIGRKSDSLYFTYNDGLQRDTVLIPMNVLSTWTINYEISNSRAKPTTPSRTNNEFTDTLYFYNNRTDSTRITSMRIGINFNPRNVMIKDFRIDTTAFPPGWTVTVENFKSTEKYGKLLFTAHADTNSPEELRYFTGGSDSTKLMLGTFTGIQLLGTSDTTRFYIDTTYSQHNYSKDYVFQKDTNNVTDRIPYIRSIGGVNTADSMLFLNQFLLDSNDPSARIIKIYPNPVGQNNDDLWIDIDVLKKTSTINLKIIEAVRGTIIHQEAVKIDKGLHPTLVNIAGMLSGTYILVLATETNTDAWLFQIVK